jgi:hypothetical protein
MKIHVDFTVELSDNEVKDYKEYFDNCCQGFKQKYKDYRDYIREDIKSYAIDSAENAYNEMFEDLMYERGESYKSC